MPSPLLTVKQNHDWRNKHQNVGAKPATFYDVFNLWIDEPAPNKPTWRPGLAGLRAIVAEAERSERRVRGLGGAWSLSEAAVCSDIMVNTRPLNFIELGLRATSLDPAFAGEPGALCFTQCGASVMELYQYLEPRGFTLPTGGASNGQTIAGAVSTGTHGAAHSIGSMQEYIVGIHLVIDGGKHVWIERASRPVVSQAFCNILGAELRRDDELFRAAVVSFGSFGMVHAYLFEAEPIYLLDKSVTRFDYAAVRPVLSTLEVGALDLPGGNQLPFHFEVVVDPYHTGDGEQGAYVRAMYKRPFAEQPPGGAVSSAGLVQGDDVMGFLGGITSITPDVVPIILGHLLPGQLNVGKTKLGTPGQQFGSTEFRGLIMSTEIGVALADAQRAVDAVIDVAKQFPFPGFPAVRYVKGSDATLAFTRFSPVTCTIEIPSAGSDRTKAAFERIWTELHRRNIVFTLHWGQCLRPAAIHFSSAYGDRVARWTAARAGLLSASGRRVFSSDWLDAFGFS